MQDSSRGNKVVMAVFRAGKFFCSHCVSMFREVALVIHLYCSTVGS